MERDKEQSRLRVWGVQQRGRIREMEVGEDGI